MSEWKEYRLGDIVTILGGFAYKGEHIGHGEGLLLGMGCVSFKEKFLMSGARPYAGDCAERYYANPGDLVLATRQQSDNLPILGMPAIIPQELDGKKLIVGANLYRVSNNSDFSNKYLYWLLKSNAYVNYIASCKTGTTVSMITKSNVEDFVFRAPDKEERNRIESVLSSLDDKIDLLHRENATLEVLAETLFRHYFIENPNPEWNEGKLGDYVEIKRGGSPRPINDYLSPTGYRWLKISDVTNLNSPYIFQTKEYIKESGLNKTVYLEEGALVLSNSATPGIPKILCVDSCIHDGWLYFPKAFFSNNYLYLFFKSIRQDLINLGNGSIFTNLKTEILKDYKICVPDDNSLVEFERKVNPMFEKINQNTRQIISLSSQRDTLLPRLMSGEIKIERIGYGK